MDGKQRVFIGAESFAPKASGIGRVARLVAKVLGEEVRDGHLEVSGNALNDSQPSREFGFPLDSSQGSHWRFVRHSYAACLSRAACIYDHLGIARAHLQLPFHRQPFMAFIHGIEVWEQAPTHRIKWARKADILLANSQFTREKAQRCHGGFDQAIVCWLATETDTLPDVVKKSGPPTVLIVGRIDWPCYKGQVEVVSAWPSVLAAIPEARLVVAGNGDGLNPLRQLAARLPCADRIEFRGFVPESQMDELWATATVFAMPSRKEGFGLVYIEAMRQAVPVIASIHDASSEVNLDGETGYNVNLDRPDELRDRLIYLLKNPDAAAALGRQGQARWAKHFRYSAFRERFLPIVSDFVHRAA